MPLCSMRSPADQLLRPVAGVPRHVGGGDGRDAPVRDRGADRSGLWGDVTLSAACCRRGHRAVRPAVVPRRLPRGHGGGAGDDPPARAVRPVSAGGDCCSVPWRPTWSVSSAGSRSPDGQRGVRAALAPPARPRVRRRLDAALARHAVWAMVVAGLAAWSAHHPRPVPSVRRRPVRLVPGDRHYPKSLLGTDVERVSNAYPPTLCFLLGGVWTIGAVMLLRSALGVAAASARLAGHDRGERRDHDVVPLAHDGVPARDLVAAVAAGSRPRAGQHGEWWLERVPVDRGAGADPLGPGGDLRSLERPRRERGALDQSAVIPSAPCSVPVRSRPGRLVPTPLPRGVVASTRASCSRSPACPARSSLLRRGRRSSRCCPPEPSRAGRSRRWRPPLGSTG